MWRRFSDATRWSGWCSLLLCQALLTTTAPRPKEYSEGPLKRKDLDKVREVTLKGSRLLEQIMVEETNATSDGGHFSVSTTEVLLRLSSQLGTVTLVECFRSFKAQGAPLSVEVIFSILIHLDNKSKAAEFVKEGLHSEAHLAGFLDESAVAEADRGALYTWIATHPSCLITAALQPTSSCVANALRVLGNFHRHKALSTSYFEDLAALLTSSLEVEGQTVPPSWYSLDELTPLVEYLVTHWEVYWWSLSQPVQVLRLGVDPVKGEYEENRYRKEPLLSLAERDQWREATTHHREEAVQALTKVLAPEGTDSTSEYSCVPLPLLKQRLEEHSEAVLVFYFRLDATAPLPQGQERCEPSLLYELTEYYSRLLSSERLRSVFGEVVEMLEKTFVRKGGRTKTSVNTFSVYRLLLRRCIAKTDVNFKEAQQFIEQLFGLNWEEECCSPGQYSLLSCPDIMKAWLKKKMTKEELGFLASILRGKMEEAKGGKQWEYVLNRGSSLERRGGLTALTADSMLSFHDSVLQCVTVLYHAGLFSDAFFISAKFLTDNIHFPHTLPAVMRDYKRHLFQTLREQVGWTKEIVKMGFRVEWRERRELLRFVFEIHVKKERNQSALPNPTSVPGDDQHASADVLSVKRSSSTIVTLNDRTVEVSLEGMGLLRRVLQSFCTTFDELPAASQLFRDILCLLREDSPSSSSDLCEVVKDMFWDVALEAGETLLSLQLASSFASFEQWLTFLSHLPPKCGSDQQLTLCLFTSMSILVHRFGGSASSSEKGLPTEEKGVVGNHQRELIERTASALAMSFTGLPLDAVSPPLVLNWLVSSGYFDFHQAISFLMAQFDGETPSFLYLALPIDRVTSLPHALRLLVVLRHLEKQTSKESTTDRRSASMEVNPLGDRYQRVRRYSLHVWYVRALSSIFDFLKRHPQHLSLSAVDSAERSSYFTLEVTQSVIPVEFLSHFVLQEVNLRSPYLSYLSPLSESTPDPFDHRDQSALKRLLIRHHTPSNHDAARREALEDYSSLPLLVLEDIKNFPPPPDLPRSTFAEDTRVLHEGLISNYIDMVAAVVIEGHRGSPVKDHSIHQILQYLLLGLQDGETKRRREVNCYLPDPNLTLSLPEYQQLRHTLSSLLERVSTAV